MENLTAFVRERTQRTEAEQTARLDQRVRERAYSLWENAGRPEGRREEFWRQAVERESYEPPATDIVAVLTVIERRSADRRELEGTLDFRRAVFRGIDLGRAHLEGVDLSEAHFERADLSRVHLERANLMAAHLEGANLSRVHLERANLMAAHLEGANLSRVHLERADLSWVHLERADLSWARLERANLMAAHLEGANLVGVHGLTQTQIDAAFGDAKTALPAELARPAHWTEPKDDGAAPAA